MSDYSHDFAVFIGRFQPFHFGHKAVVDKALSIAKHVIIFIGSANLGRDTRNPFTFEERVNMLHSEYAAELDQDRMTILPLDDFTYDNNGWIEQVQDRVSRVVQSISNKGWKDKVSWGPKSVGDQRVTLIGRNKDNTSFYLKLFPNWDQHDVFDDNVAILNATDIRNAMFDSKNATMFAAHHTANDMPVAIFNNVSKFINTPTFQDIIEEHDYCQVYKQPYAVLPYKPTFNTVDAVIRCSGHILLITRRARPGKGKLALPGGFLEPDENLFDSCIREVYEETKIKISKEELKLCFRKQHVFDDPHRDPRGRFITQAFFFDLGDRIKLPQVKGGSDASKAQWVPIADLQASTMFGDHYFIIRALLK